MKRLCTILETARILISIVLDHRDKLSHSTYIILSHIYDDLGCVQEELAK